MTMIPYMTISFNRRCIDSQLKENNRNQLTQFISDPHHISTGQQLALIRLLLVNSISIFLPGFRSLVTFALFSIWIWGFGKMCIEVFKWMSVNINSINLIDILIFPIPKTEFWPKCRIVCENSSRSFQTWVKYRMKYCCCSLECTVVLCIPSFSCIFEHCGISATNLIKYEIGVCSEIETLKAIVGKHKKLYVINLQ